jgi:ribosomal protein S12 methylthiotransferase accessory factor
VEVDIHLPGDFPQKYRRAVVRAAETCSVKRYLQDPFAITTRVLGD